MIVHQLHQEWAFIFYANAAKSPRQFLAFFRGHRRVRILDGSGVCMHGAAGQALRAFAPDARQQLRTIEGWIYGQNSVS